MPASCATSWRRRPGVRRRAPSGSPTSAGRSRSRRARRKAASSSRRTLMRPGYPGARRSRVRQDRAVDEVRLPGGFVSDVVRVGATVRRKASPNTGFVRELLDLFAERGWQSAPRFHGFDADGREVLDYLEGHVAWDGPQPAGVECDESLAMVAQLVRQFHDLTAGTPLAADQQVVCHNDLSPRNTVYRDLGNGLRPVAFLDWDIAAPGRRVHDVAHMCWQYLGLGPS